MTIHKDSQEFFGLSKPLKQNQRLPIDAPD